MKKLVLFILLVTPLVGQSQKITLRSVTEVDLNTIPYPNLAGNTTSSQAHKGSVKLVDGTTLKGKITFFKKKDVFTRVKVNTGDEKKEIMAEQIAAIT